MRAKPSAVAAATMIMFCLAVEATPLHAQAIEIMPFVGYRFGGDLFELMAGQRVDTDGAPSAGVVVNVPLADGLQVEALFTHQHASFSVPTGPLLASTPWKATVAHAQVGGLQELTNGRVRPFLTGMLGLTRYAADQESEVRFTVGSGGGVKLFPTSRVGVRLDGRVHATFVDADARVVACATGRCLTAFHADVVWQAEFTAGVVFRLR